MFYLCLLLLLAVFPHVDACHPRFEKELRYLDLYLGIRPDNDGDIPSKESAEFASYVSSAQSLDCDFESECLWRNAVTDGLLDTSDFWYFKTLFRPRINCHILRPGNDICNVRIPPVTEPFRLAIRAFNLKSSGMDKTHPTSAFLFLAVDSLSPRRYATLRSELIPCTQATTTLSMRYWLKAGTQVEVCSVDIDGIALSCAYLSEEDSPGPIEIDVDAYDQPFRFTMEMIAFDETSIGLVAISDIQLKGLLCSEEPPPVVTTIDPPTIVSLFGLQQGPGPNTPYPSDLNCDFSKDYCSQWVNDDGLVAYGVAPRNSEKFPLPSGIKGNVATFVLEGMKTSMLRSREVSCAYNASVTVTYMRSEHGLVRLCALGHCVDGSKVAGEMTVVATSAKPFEVTRNLCNYESPVDKADDIALIPGPKGATATLDMGRHRAILRSPKFDLPSPLILNITVTQATFGSRVLLCPDISSESESCHELLGPKVETSEKKAVIFPLDEGAQRLALVLYHDKAEQFGPAHFILHSVDIRSSQNEMLC
ncbi:hypothetical protein NECAME_16681 [Necator americanus]|uniref:MAM domain-containing protein n=1 Tax=Necator americanus TaxID=51031 RepID=W2TXF1_NECAM|nr:hypothetical protein NECAME_16681 [Necator americanus]ETN85712.1 hypothetical protein NECAME_16681 [Necator americanus]